MEAENDEEIAGNINPQLQSGSTKSEPETNIPIGKTIADNTKAVIDANDKNVEQTEKVEIGKEQYDSDSGEHQSSSDQAVLYSTPEGPNDNAFESPEESEEASKQHFKRIWQKIGKQNMIYARKK